MRDRALGSTIRMQFVSTNPDGGGAPVAPSSAFAAADIRIYKDGSASEKTTTNGITVTSPFDSITGLHLVEIDTSNSTGDTGFWASGSVYHVRLVTAKTVATYSVSGLLIGEFSLELQTADVRKFGGTAITSAAGIPEVKVASIATDAVNAAALAANAVTEIQSGLATASDQTAIKAKTDQLTFTTSNKVDSTAVLDADAQLQLDSIESALQALRVSESTVVERSVTDTNALTFAWPVSGATITATRSINNATYGAVAGTIAFLRTESSKHYYTLSHDVADRPSAEGQVRYKFVDGTYTRYVVLRVVVSGLDETTQSQLDDIEADSAASVGYLTSLTTAVAAIAAIFTGMTSLPNWLRRAFRKDAGTAGMVTAQSEINTGGTATFNGTTDSLEGVRDGITDVGSASVTTMLSTTIASVTSQTVLVLTSGSADNDVYNDQLVVITDASTSTQKARMLVSDYVGSTKTLTLASAPGFTVAAGDSIAIIAVAGLTAAQRNQLALIGSGNRITVKADLGTSIALKIGDTYSAARGTAKRIDVNDADSSIYDMLTGDDITSIDFGLSNATTIDVVTGTVDPETITHTAASGSASAYTTVYVEVEVDADLKPFCGDYDIQITYDDDTRQTPFGGKCELVRDFKS